MHRKDFQAIAAVISAEGAKLSPAQHKSLAEATANALANHLGPKSKFDWQMFYTSASTRPIPRPRPSLRDAEGILHLEGLGKAKLFQHYNSPEMVGF